MFKLTFRERRAYSEEAPTKLYPRKMQLQQSINAHKQIELHDVCETQNGNGFARKMRKNILAGSAIF
jgi:hypothetical protein